MDMPQRREQRSFVINFVMDQHALEKEVEKTKILKTNMPGSFIG